MWLNANKIAGALGGNITIGNCSSGCISGNGYRLRVGYQIERYTNAQASHKSIYMTDVPTITEPIPASGYPCIPGAIYKVHSMETGASSIYNIMLCGTEEGGLRGINVLNGGLLTGDCQVLISVVQPVMIKPGDFYAKLQFHQDPQQPAREHCCTGYPLCVGRVYGVVPPYN